MTTASDRSRIRLSWRCEPGGARRSGPRKHEARCCWLWEAW